MKSNSRVEKAVIDATTGQDASYEGMKSALRNVLQAEGVIVRDRESEFGVHMIPQPQTTVALPVNSPAPTCERIVYPGGNTRCEIFGMSEQDLDQKEAALRAMFGGQR
jgi:hypothetical protein